jgi:hypothetical protein
VCNVKVLPCVFYSLSFSRRSVILDLKGTQYTGYLYPAPTALIVSLATCGTDDVAELKIEAMTDEFCSLTKTGDAMAKMSAVFEQGDKDEFTLFHDGEDVNWKPRSTDTSAPSEEIRNGDSNKRKRPPNNHKSVKSNASQPVVKKRKKSKTTKSKK